MLISGNSGRGASKGGATGAQCAFAYALPPLPLIAVLPSCRCAPPPTCRYDIKAPSMFNTRNVGKTLVTRTQGTKVGGGGGAQPAAAGRGWRVCLGMREEACPGIAVADARCPSMLLLPACRLPLTGSRAAW